MSCFVSLCKLLTQIKLCHFFNKRIKIFRNAPKFYLKITNFPQNVTFINFFRKS